MRASFIPAVALTLAACKGREYPVTPDALARWKACATSTDRRDRTPPTNVIVCTHPREGAIRWEGRIEYTDDLQLVDAEVMLYVVHMPDEIRVDEAGGRAAWSRVFADLFVPLVGEDGAERVRATSGDNHCWSTLEGDPAICGLVSDSSAGIIFGAQFSRPSH